MRRLQFLFGLCLVAALLWLGMGCEQRTKIEPVNYLEPVPVGMVRMQLTGRNIDSVNMAENFELTHFSDVNSGFYLQPDGSYMFNLNVITSPSEKLLQGNFNLNFALDSIRARTPKAGQFLYAFLNYTRQNPTNPTGVRFSQEWRSNPGRPSQDMEVTGLIYNPDSRRFLGNFRFRQQIGLQDTVPIYGPQIRGSFDVRVPIYVR